MRNINIREAKTHSSGFSGQATAGEELVIARGG
ncbi:type II toxin-antitoxin system Phd/YefM family antitoxin [Lamprobacter sp.]